MKIFEFNQDINVNKNTNRRLIKEINNLLII